MLPHPEIMKFNVMRTPSAGEVKSLLVQAEREVVRTS